VQFALNPESLAVQDGASNYTHWLTDILPILWRRQRAIYVALVITSAAAVLFYSAVGERYESYTLLRVGQGIKDRSTGSILGEGPDLTSRIESLARIATTDQVIRLAASEVGFSRLFKKDESSFTLAVRAWLATGLQALPAQFDFLKSRTEVNGAKENAAKDSANETKDSYQQQIAKLRDLISARAEGRTDILRVSFRHPDRTIAAQFLNELANALIATQADLVQIPGAEVFFQQQTKRLEQEAEKAGTDLRNFSVAATIYSVEDQRRLLLQRADALGTLLASTRSSIEERRGQKQAILDQLVTLRPVHQSRTVSAIVSDLRGRDYKPTDNTVGTVQSDDAPPLLLIKVYQDAMANLLKVNTDLNGSLNVEKALTVELDKVNEELASLSSKQAEYDRLKRVLTRASTAADHYGSRVIEEQINQDIAKKTQLSSVRVVQRAEKSTLPMFPQAVHLVLLALVGGLALGSGVAVMLEFMRARRPEEDEDEVGPAIEEVVKRSVRNHLREIQAAE
jgi:polysaccharide biosynthesis transport protein